MAKEYRTTIHEYTIEESSQDTRTWTVTSEKKLSEHKLNMIAQDGHMNPNSIEVIRDDDNIIQVEYDGVTYGDDSQVSVYGDTKDEEE